MIYTQFQKLQGRTLYTLRQNKAFDVLSVTPSAITVFIHDSGKERIVPMSQIEPAWEYLLNNGVLTLGEIVDRGFSARSPVYVASLLATLTGVSHGRERHGDGGRPVVTLRYA